MEGGLLLHAAWLLSFVFVWVYRRWFETNAPRAPEFERFCATRPLLAALSVEPGTETQARAALLALLPRGETVPTLGPWPWIHHALALELGSRAGSVTITISGCRLLRSHELPPPALPKVLGELKRRLGPSWCDAWLCAPGYVDVSGATEAPHGWRIAEGDAPTPRFEPWRETPAWARQSRAETRTSAVSARQLPSCAS